MTNQDLTYSPFEVKVLVGTPIYVGRAIAGHELVFDAEAGGWHNVSTGASAGLSRRLRWVAFGSALVAVAAVCIAALAWRAASPIAQDDQGSRQRLPVPAFDGSKDHPLVESVEEPYRRTSEDTGNLPKVMPQPQPLEAIFQPAAAASAVTPKSKLANAKQDEAGTSGPILNRTVQEAAQQGPAVKEQAPPSPASPKVSGPRVRLVTLLDSKTIVVSDPASGLPRPFEIGASLHDGSVLQSIDLKSQTATTSKGVLRLE